MEELEKAKSAWVAAEAVLNTKVRVQCLCQTVSALNQGQGPNALNQAVAAGSIEPMVSMPDPVHIAPRFSFGKACST